MSQAGRGTSPKRIPISRLDRTSRIGVEVRRPARGTDELFAVCGAVSGESLRVCIRRDSLTVSKPVVRLTSYRGFPAS